MTYKRFFLFQRCALDIDRVADDAPQFEFIADELLLPVASIESVHVPLGHTSHLPALETLHTQRHYCLLRIILFITLGLNTLLDSRGESLCYELFHSAWLGLWGLRLRLTGYDDGFGLLVS